MSLKKRKINNIYYEPITFDNVYKTWKIVRGTCKNRKAVFNYSLNKNTNTYVIYTVLKEKNINLSPLDYS